MTPDEIRTARLSLGMTQEQFAHALGYHGRHHVGKWENGKLRMTKRTVAAVRLLMKGE